MLKKIGNIRELKYIITALSFVVFTPLFLKAQQGIKFKANVNKNKVPVNRRLKVTYSINANGTNFDPPPFKNFKVLGGPNRSTQVRIVNGQVTRKTKYSFILTPVKKGTFTLPPATITVKGNKLHSNDIKVKVTPPQQNKAQGKKKGGTSSIKKKLKNNIFLRTTVNKKEVYQGEALVATYQLYTRVSITNYKVEDMPSLTGFWTYKVKSPKKPQFSNTQYKGKRFKVATIKKVLLFPQKTGELKLDPLKMKTTVRVKTKQKRKRRRSLLDAFFNTRLKNIDQQLSSNPIIIDVEPLPKKGQPKNFNGAVGDFSLQTELAQNKTKVNAPVNLKVQLKGKGNLKLIDPFKLSLSPDLEKYDPEIKDDITINAAGMSGTRIFDYLIIPRYEGKYDIPAIKFSYFNPQKEKYVTKSTDPLALKVKGQKKAQRGGRTGGGKKAVKKLGQDILFIETGSVDFRKQGSAFIASPLFYILFLLPALLIIGGIIYLRKKKQWHSDTPLMRQKRAHKLAQNRLSSAYSYLEENNKEAFYEEMLRALWGYLSDKMNMPQSELTHDHIQHTLHQQGVKENMISEVKEVLEDCEFARYASGEHEVNQEKLYKRGQQLIATLEEQLNNT